MRDVVKVHSVRRYKAGYEVRDEEILTHWEDKPKGDTFRMKSAYTPNGDYIGNPRDAHYLCVKRGIAPQLRTEDSNVCSIGYCAREGKWYGWSHRAIYGFKPGSKVEKGDCGFMARNRQEFKEECLRFWDDEYHKKTWAVFGTDKHEDGTVRRGVHVRWIYNDEVPDESLRGTQGGVFFDYPEEWGRGEWTAETTADAKQMACDFAEGVS